MRILNKKYWPYKVLVKNDCVYVTDDSEMEKWCSNNLKDNTWKSVGWALVTFYFKQADDATAFKLRWM